MQKSLIVKDDRYGVDDLERYLSKGWVVVHTCPMPSSVAMNGTVSYAKEEVIRGTCLVILEDKEVT